ncbi:MAG: methyl-accepting chemotaxis protein [Colwellia sp.]|jgi:methyl-accepting chemotaxis protein
MFVCEHERPVYFNLEYILKNLHLEQLYKTTDIFLFKVLLISWGLAFAYAFVYSTWLEAMLIGGLIVSFPAYLVYSGAGSSLNRHIMPIAFFAMVALHIQQLNGMIEAHFGFFVCAAFFFLYKDYKVFITTAVVGVFLHLSLFFLQSAQLSITAFPENTNIFIVLLHGFYLCVECLLLGFAAKNSRGEATISSMLHEVTRDKGTLNLNVSTSDKSLISNQFTFVLKETGDAVLLIRQNNNELFQNVVEVTSLMSQASSSINHQLNLTTEIATATTQLSTTIEIMAEQSKITEQRSLDAVNENEKAMSAVLNSRQSILDLEQQVKLTSQSISTLSQQAKSIETVLDIINAISEQTNLLALNAAIEAARAGEHGRGFAVVADEVRNLASRTKQSIEEIHGTISGLQAGSNEAVSVMELCSEIIHQNVTATQEVETLIKQASNTISQVSTLNQQTLDSIEEQSIVSKDIAARALQIKTGLSDTDENISNVSNVFSNIDSGIKSLSQKLNKFALAD